MPVIFFVCQFFFGCFFSEEESHVGPRCVENCINALFEKFCALKPTVVFAGVFFFLAGVKLKECDKQPNRAPPITSTGNPVLWRLSRGKRCLRGYHFTGYSIGYWQATGNFF